jgi:MFS family permease
MVNYLLSQFATGMTNGFGVLFIYQLASSFKQGILYIFLFAIFQRLTVGLLIPLIGRLIAHLGHRKIMIVSLAALAFKIWLFTLTTQTNLWPLFFASILGGISVSGYYLSFHSIFLEDNDDLKVGEQMGIMTMLGRASWILGPLLAGFLVDNFGFTFMFTVVLLVLLISILPLLTMQQHLRHRVNYSNKQVLSLIKNHPKFSSSIFLWFISDAIQTFYWPVFLIISLGTYTKFGELGSLVFLINSFAVYLSAKLYDRKRGKNIFITSSLVVSLTWFARFLSNSPTNTVASDISHRLVSPFWWSKIRKSELMLGEKNDSLVFGAAHELVATMGIITALVLGYLALTQTQALWLWLIPITVGSTLFTTWIVKDNNDEA